MVSKLKSIDVEGIDLSILHRITRAFSETRDSKLGDMGHRCDCSFGAVNAKVGKTQDGGGGGVKWLNGEKRLNMDPFPLTAHFYV